MAARVGLAARDDCQKMLWCKEREPTVSALSESPRFRIAGDALLRKIPRRPLCLPDELPTVPLRSRPVPVADAGESRSPDPFATGKGAVSGVPSPACGSAGTAGSE